MSIESIYQDTYKSCVKCNKNPIINKQRGLCNSCTGAYNKLKLHLASPLIECACGICHEMIHSIGKDGKPVKYKNGHYQKGRKGENSTSWRGGKKRAGRYYKVFRPNHPKCDAGGYVFEHRVVYEEYNNVCLLPWTEIHHKNFKPRDNRIENLRAVLKEEHKYIHKNRRRNRKCKRCGSRKTYNTTKTKRPRWFRVKDGFICMHCHDLEYCTVKKQKELQSQFIFQTMFFPVFIW